MIFSAKNNKGIPTWQLILTDKKTVTRRLKPLKVGSIYAVNPGRYKKHVCKIRILHCEKHNEAFDRLVTEAIQKGKKLTFKSLGSFLSSAWKLAEDILNEEAKIEGFSTWLHLYLWFCEQDVDINKTYRIEFERVT